MNESPALSASDLAILRDLARRKAAAAAHPDNLQRRELWLRHDAGSAGSRPMVLAEVGGVRAEAFPDSVCQCSDPWARRLEYGLRMELYQFDVLRDDHVIEPFIQTGWTVQSTGYGVQAVPQHADNDGRLGARRWEPALADLDRDLERLRPRQVTVDREATLAGAERLSEIFAGILPVRIRGGYWWTMGMTIVAIDLIGLEPLMMAMYDNPAGLHRLMAFLRDDHIGYAAQLEAAGVLTLNNENDYIGSGSMGYTRDLPAPGLPSGAPARTRDLWLLLESQETVGVGPDQFEEFIFPYQMAIAERFGRIYYGCCEPVHTRWHVLRRMPNLARVSVSPWADEEALAREFGSRYVFSRKPNPTLISTSVFDEGAIRQDIRRTLEATRGVRVELIMKDVHTLNNEPQRLPRWVAIAREEIDRLA